MRLEVTCACGEVHSLDALAPYGACACGAELVPDLGELVAIGRA